jgi:polysaccharide chain length determinant protein (PEP-CTERM system associated)
VPLATNQYRSGGSRNGESNREQVVREMLATAESYVRGMWRYHWRAIGVMWLICLVGWTAVSLLPPVYQANARVFVDTENAIKPLVAGIASTSNVLNEVTIVTREMLSRPNLAEVARLTELDARASTKEEFENLLTSLQERISVEGNRENVFSISYQDADSDKAVAVVDALVKTFVERSLGADRDEAGKAQIFLQNQIAEYEARLTAAENRLADFKRENMAYMPDQRGDYFDRLQFAERALASARAKMRSAEERRSELNRQLEGEEPVFGLVSSGERSSPSAGGYSAAKVRELRLELDELRLQYTDRHPRIRQILDTIDMLEKDAQEQMLAGGDQGSALDSLSQTPLELNPVYQNMRIQLSNTEVEIAALRTELQQQGREVHQLQAMVDAVPQVEAELGRLNRDYGVIKSKYEQLVVQLETANIGEDVEASINDVQFRIIDPTFAATTPVGPKRQLMVIAVFIAAIGAGVGLAFVLDQVHPVFFSERDILSTTGLPVLGAVGLAMTPLEVRLKRNSHARVGFVFVLLLVVFAVAATATDATSPLVRQIVGLV